MIVGDRVKHQSGDFEFEGSLMGTVVTSKGRRIAIVEQYGTGFVQLFGETSLTVLEKKLPVMGELYPDEVPKYVPPPRPTMPLIIFVPIQPVSGSGNMASAFKTRVKQYYLTPKPHASLIIENVAVEFEFHFKGNEVGDVDNLIKPSLDALKGSVLYDDKQVKRVTAEYFPNSDKDGFRVKITPYAKKS